MKSNYKWFDFGGGKQILEAPLLKMMLNRDQHEFKLFTSRESDNKPIGMVALSDITYDFKTATLWYLLGEKNYAGQQFTTQAVGRMLNYAFGEFNLETIYAWAVESNKASIRVLEKNNFRLIGKRRKCHYVDGKARDRWLFDLLEEEHN